MSLRHSYVFEDLFTDKSYKLSEDPAIYIKEGSHTVVLENNFQNEKTGCRTFNVNTAIVRNEQGVLGVIVYCEGEGKSEDDKATSESLSVIGELAASAVHEIKNPLFSIRGFLQILDNTLSESDKRKEYVKIMISEVDRLESLTKDFLMLAKIKSDSKELVWVCELIKEVIELYKSSFEKKKIRFRLYMNDESIFLWADRDQLEQVFINLIQNAFEAVEEGGSIDIIVSKLNEKVKVEVKDNGRGIGPEVKDKIFSPFFTTKKNGTGLGLFISKRIVENYGGNIYFNSAQEEGTTFVVEFPIGKDH
ncbi:His Kinase A (phospho-acceptor) domain-containing protein [Caldanaerovirga acetigignens]|uniref:histidine kinase n=1 Tax=Caldanaerovirga acetigignens TaxID=447595 RepID=A0A1M7LHR4_9FIRM|nr:ATP-binding protein [Caldanaerovirga acetigignens]SHM77669.1 His Kinase A (phospho-acceptor) domain-containing protein [Caldanaerovirga acetigignens]